MDIGHYPLLAVIRPLAKRDQGEASAVIASGYPASRAATRACSSWVTLSGSIPGSPRDYPRLLRPSHVPACLLQYHLLGRGAGYGSVGSEVHQVRQHPDRLVPLSRLPLVVPVDQYPASLQGAGPLDHRLAAVGVLLLGADRFALARRQAQGEQPAAARFLDLDLLQERDEGPRRLQPLDVLLRLLGDQVQVHGQAVNPAAPCRLLARRTRSCRVGGRDDQAVVYGAHYGPLGIRTGAGERPLPSCPQPGRHASCCYLNR